MTKSLRERQLKEQILGILKDAGKPLMLLSIYAKLDKKGEKLGHFWREKAKEAVYELVRKRQLKDVYGDNSKVKSYKWIDPNSVPEYVSQTYRGDFKIPYIPPRGAPARAGAMDFLNHKSLG